MYLNPLVRRPYEDKVDLEVVTLFAEGPSHHFFYTFLCESWDLVDNSADNPLKSVVLPAKSLGFGVWLSGLVAKQGPTCLADLSCDRHALESSDSQWNPQDWE